MRPYQIAAMLTLVLSATTQAGTRVEITTNNGTKDETYLVDFGGGKLNEKYTAFDPASKNFVYLDFPRAGDKPEPAGKIWDHRTGETISLYKFPGVAQPLPVIPSIEALTICPKTGRMITSKKTLIFFD